VLEGGTTGENCTKNREQAKLEREKIQAKWREIDMNS